MWNEKMGYLAQEISNAKKKNRLNLTRMMSSVPQIKIYQNEWLCSKILGGVNRQILGYNQRRKANTRSHQAQKQDKRAY